MVLESNLICHQETCLLREILRAFNTNNDIEEQLKIILNLSNTVMHSQASFILIVDEEHNSLIYKILSSSEKEKNYGDSLKVPMNKGIVGWVARNKEPVIVNNRHKDERYYPVLDKVLDFDVKNILCVPLMKGNKFLGVLEVLNKNHGESDYTQADLDNYITLAAQVSVVIENLLLYDKLKQEIALNESIIEIIKEISSSLQQEDILEKVMSIITKFIKYDSGAFCAINEGDKKLSIIRLNGYEKNN